MHSKYSSWSKHDFDETDEDLDIGVKNERRTIKSYTVHKILDI